MNQHIRQQIYSRTRGAQGSTVMLLRLYQKMRDKGDVTEEQWCMLTRFEQQSFMSFISGFENFRVMEKSALTNQKDLIKHFSDLSLMPTNVIKQLKTANIIAEGSNVEFASPFVQQYLRCFFFTSSFIQTPTPRRNGGQVDFPQLVEKALPAMNRLLLQAADKKKNYGDQRKDSIQGPKEITYANEFASALSNISTEFIDVQYEESVGIKRADQKITFDYMNTIVVEHEANLSYTADNQSYSMSHHYEKALDYHKKINPEQTWLINWTTNDTVWRPNEFHDVMIIHHDQSFGSFTIKIIDRNQEAPIISVVEVSANEYNYKQESNNNL
ncbi:hypothetical protein AKO1_015183 [Acrasis kona]|uniref:Uncharacterized protein n=1 Tax=Acrasis kona TaxID=1008807 RepID=A0AAW2ZEY8_9EUKA